MKGEKLKLVRGSGNVFRDLGRKNVDLEQLKSLLAAEIIKALDREGLTVRSAQARTGFATADFSRIRNADLARVTAGRLSEPVAAPRKFDCVPGKVAQNRPACLCRDHSNHQTRS